MRRIPLTRTLAGAAVLALGLIGTVPAAAQADDTYWVPAGRQLDLTGHGFGHGRGMSQYGAQGAALQGLTWQRIIGFYYPHTALGSAGGNIRVLLTSTSAPVLTVSPASGLRLTDVGNGASWALPAVSSSLDRWEVRVDASNHEVVFYRDRGGWHRWAVPGQGALVGAAELSAPGPLTLQTAYGARAYRGRLRLMPTSAGSTGRRVVDMVGLDDYVRGVVASEMPASWRPEALAAQAVAARSYAVRQREAHRTRYYHVDDTTSYQVYGGVSHEDPRADQAVARTAGTVVTYRGATALTEFTSSSGGWTVASDLPYQVSQADPYDATPANPYHTWHRSAAASALERAWPSVGRLQRLVVAGMGGGEDGGRAGRVTLVGTGGSAVTSGDSVRRLLGLPSNWWRPAVTPIMARWQQAGGSSSAVGSPADTEYAVGGGVAQRFTTGRMYAHPTAGVHEVHGPILPKYLGLGGAASSLGFPTSDISNPALVGTQRLFLQHGWIFYGPLTGAHEVHQPILRAYGRTGYATGPLGLPTTDVRGVPGGLRSNFQHGYISWSSATGQVEVHRD